MMVRFVGLVTAGVIFLFATGVHAQSEDPKRWYLAVGGGGAWYQQQDFTDDFGGRAEADMDTGFTFNGAIGGYIDNIRVVRLEAEALYVDADVDEFEFGTPATGSVSKAAVMFNVYYDIRTKTSWVPYVGGGIGYSYVDIDNVSTLGVPVFDDSDGEFAWQLKFGVAYEVNPSWTITGGYRYHKSDSLESLNPIFGRVVAAGPESHSAELGLRLNF